MGTASNHTLNSKRTVRDYTQTVICTLIQAPDIDSSYIPKIRAWINKIKTLDSDTSTFSYEGYIVTPTEQTDLTEQEYEGQLKCDAYIVAVSYTESVPKMTTFIVTDGALTGENSIAVKIIEKFREITGQNISDETNYIRSAILTLHI